MRRGVWLAIRFLLPILLLCLSIIAVLPTAVPSALAVSTRSDSSPSPLLAPASVDPVVQSPRPLDQALAPAPDALPAAPAAPAAPLQSRWACTVPAINGLAPYAEWGTAPGIPLPHGQLKFLNDGSSLYILADLTGDTVADPPQPSGAPYDFFWLSFDVDRDGKITPNTDLNYTFAAGTFNFGKQFYLGPNTWTAMTTTTSLLGIGFAPSSLSPTPHRIWEFAIDESEINAGPGQMVRLGLRTFSPTPPFDDNLPANFTSDFSSLVEVNLASGPCTARLTKSGSPGTVQPGDILNYELTYAVGGGGTVNDVRISDALPPGVTFLPGSITVPLSYLGGVLTFKLGDLPGGSSGVLSFQVLVTQDACGRQGVLINQAQLSTATPAQQVASNLVVTDVSCPPVNFPTNDPPYAESEITVDPYPLVTGQLTKLSTTVHNNSATTQTVNVAFRLANFGIGQPFTLIAAPGNPRVVTIPPGGTVDVSIFWTPNVAGHQCVEVLVTDVGQKVSIRSQRNLDVNEVLTPGQKTSFTVPVMNSSGVTETVAMVVRNTCPGWVVTLSPTMFNLVPGGSTNVVVSVTPPPGGMLGTHCTVDIEAWVIDPQTGARLSLIGGIRKIDEPQIPLGRPGEPPYAESEISISPYPLNSGVPTQACVTLSNNTDVSQTVTVEFDLASLGIGLVYNRVPSISGPNPQTVVIPPHSTVKVCITFLPTVPGHQCMRVSLTSPGGYQTFSYRNLDIAERLVAGQPTDTLIPVGNPTANPADIDLVVVNTCPGWTAMVIPAMLLNVGPNSSDIRNVTLRVIPPPGLLGTGCHIDLQAFINGILIGGVRKIDRPPVTPSGEPPYAEREITVNPDPPVVGQPTQLCVTLTNPTDQDQKVNVTFAAADFGAGIPFTNIQTVNNTIIPAHGTVTLCITWTPGVGGTLHRCVRVQVQQAGYVDVFSQRNLDLRRLRPVGQVYPINLPVFSVRNPLPGPAQIQLDLQTIGIRRFMPPFPGIPIDLIDMQTGMVIDWGDGISFMGNETRMFMVRLGQPMGYYGVARPSAEPFMLGDQGVLDVIPYVDGQPIFVDGVQSAVEFEVDAPAQQFLPLIAR